MNSIKSSYPWEVLMELSNRHLVVTFLWITSIFLKHCDLTKKREKMDISMQVYWHTQTNKQNWHLTVSNIWYMLETIKVWHRSRNIWQCRIPVIFHIIYCKTLWIGKAEILQCLSKNDYFIYSCHYEFVTLSAETGSDVYQ